MKKTLLFLLLLVTQISYSQIVTIPDANFKAALIADGVDTNNDGEIQVSEAEAVTEIGIRAENIDSLEGILSFINLTKLDCANNNLSALELSSLDNLNELICGGNVFTSLDLSGLTSLTYFSCYNGNLNTINLSDLVNLDRLVLSRNQLSALDLTMLTNLTSLRCDSNQLTSLNLTSLAQLNHLTISDNQISTIDVSNLDNLISFSCSNNPISELDISGLDRLAIFSCAFNQLTTLDASNLPNLSELNCYDNQLTTLNISGSTKIRRLRCYDNQLTSLDVSELPQLDWLYCSSNQLTSLDISMSSVLERLVCSENQLITLNIKNGSSQELNVFHIQDNPSLQYVCTDTDERQEVQNIINSYGYTNCVINSYCTFIAGGNPSYITGNVKLDLNNDGCDANDIGFGGLKLEITNSSNVSDTYSTNADGSYNIALPEDSYTIEYVLENPSYFNVSPTSFTVDFATDTSPFQQGFCLTANGVVDDLEIQIIPLEQARPGFDADYKIIYKNNGTNTVSGNVTLTYDDTTLDFLSASPSESVSNTGQLSWAYTNLTPSESREILFTMNLNTPTDTPPLNGDDILCYEAAITPTINDQRANDNTFSLKQTVVNSYDPNDKTCLEGNTVTPDLIGEYVHYLIRFENTGSASAVNIVVKDVIDTSKFDIATIVMYDSSHNPITRIQNTNEVEFIFEGINLPFDDANNDGYIAFKIKTLPSLVVGDVFENSAEIYFDFNFPIITNNEQTSIDATASINEFSLNSNITVFPNPTSNLIHIKSSLVFDSVTIYDLNGRQLHRITSTVPQLTNEADVSNLANGIYYVSIQYGKFKVLKKFIKE